MNEFCLTWWQGNSHWILEIIKSISLSIVVLGGFFLLVNFTKRLIDKVKISHPEFDESLIKITKKTVAFLLWFFAVLIVLDLFGVNTASVLTVVGASALAIGLALKDTLSNIAAGIFLLTQHHYKTGDFINCAGDVYGTINEIGLFSTKLKTPQGQDIFVPNNSILNAPIMNFSSNALRRADLSVSISYESNLSTAVDALMKYMKSSEKIENNPTPAVVVVRYADSGIDLAIRFWVKIEDYWNVYFATNAAIKRIFDEAGIVIPYPQRVITFNEIKKAGMPSHSQGVIVLNDEKNDNII